MHYDNFNMSGKYVDGDTARVMVVRVHPHQACFVATITRRKRAWFLPEEQGGHRFTLSMGRDSTGWLSIRSISDDEITAFNFLIDTLGAERAHRLWFGAGPTPQSLEEAYKVLDKILAGLDSQEVYLQNSIKYHRAQIAGHEASIDKNKTNILQILEFKTELAQKRAAALQARTEQ